MTDPLDDMKKTFKEEIVGTFGLGVRIYDVCATAEAEYDDSNGKLVIVLDRSLRLKDIAAPETYLETDWLPKRNRVEYRACPEEIDATVGEVFRFWVKKVSASIPRLSVSA